MDAPFSQDTRARHLAALAAEPVDLLVGAGGDPRPLLPFASPPVWPRSFLFPIHAGGRLPLWKLAAGLWVYDLLALFRNVRLHRALSKRALLRAEPGLRSHDLKGGAG